MTGDRDGLPPLDDDERAELDRLRARYAVCPDCGHRHAGVEFGQICIGCPCLSVPAIVGRNPPRPPVTESGRLT